MTLHAETSLTDPSCLIVEDDEALRVRLGRAMEARGFSPVLADSVDQAKALIEESPPTYAVVDLRLGDGTGIEVVDFLHAKREDSRAVIVTGYGNLTSAVAAVKAGAIDYLAKPADADDIQNALVADAGKLPDPPRNPMSADEVRWEHIRSVYELYNQNVSETARRLGMHRRTLQRILSKHLRDTEPADSAEENA